MALARITMVFEMEQDRMFHYPEECKTEQARLQEDLRMIQQAAYKQEVVSGIKLVNVTGQIIK